MNVPSAAAANTASKTTTATSMAGGSALVPILADWSEARRSAEMIYSRSLRPSFIVAPQERAARVCVCEWGPAVLSLPSVRLLSAGHGSKGRRGANGRAERKDGPE